MPKKNNVWILMSFSDNLFLKIRKKNHLNHYNQYLYSYVIFIRFKVTHLQIPKRKEKKSYLLLLLQYQTKYLKIYIFSEVLWNVYLQTKTLYKLLKHPYIFLKNPMFSSKKKLNYLEHLNRLSTIFFAKSDRSCLRFKNLSKILLKS